MAIQTDSQGFLIGERRLKEISKGIVKTENNTKEILKVLTESLKEIAPKIESGIKSAFSEANRSGKSVSAGQQDDRVVSRRLRRTVDAAQNSIETAEQAVQVAEQAIDTAQKAIKKSVPRMKRKSFDASKGNPQADTSSSRADTPKRGPDGRFLPRDGVSGADVGSSGESGFLRKMMGMLKGHGFGGADVGGVDPTVDAVKELSDIVSPVGKAFWGMSAKAIGVLRGRIKPRKQDLELPQAQEDANKNEARSDKERNRLLLRLIDAVRGSDKGGSGIGGVADLLGGGGRRGKGLGKGLKKLLKGVGKRVPLLGALLGGGMLASEWGSLDAKGKGGGIGELAGMGIGGGIGAFVGGPVGAVAGGMLGGYLGKIFGEKVTVWVDDLRKADFSGIFKSVISDIFSSAPSVAKSAFIPFSLPAMAMGAGARMGAGIRDFVSSRFGGSDSGSTPYSGESFDYSNAAGNKNTAGNVATDRKARQLGMFNALRKAGMSDDRALALVGQIGRENDFGDAMFGTHTDPAKDKNGKDIKNGGVLSWNSGRYKNFSKFMTDRGLMDAKGNMPKTQAVLDAQAEFIKKEMESSDYKKKLGKFHDGQKRDPRAYSQELASYIGWARGQETIRGTNGSRVAFDSAGQDRKAYKYVDGTAELAKGQSDQIKTDVAKAPAKAQMPNAKGKSTAPVIFKPNAPRPPAVKVPAITPDIAKIGKSKGNNNVTAQSTTNIGQTVADRGLAHIIAGGIGYGSQNA